MNMLDRRGFLGAAAMTGAAAMLGGCKCPFCGPCARAPYEDTIGDRLWMWGHHRDSFKALKGRKEQYNLPYDTRIDMAAACKEMNIPGCFVVRWTGLPTKEELPEYMKQFAATKRVGYSITDSAKDSFDAKVDQAFEYADKMPNLTTLVADDFFSDMKRNRNHIHKLPAIRERLAERGMKLSVVLYADANGVKPEFKNCLDMFDEITFWFWHGKNVNTITDQVKKLRDLAGSEKPVLLGQYMWDFGGQKPLPGKSMEIQLEHTSSLLSQKMIDGVIFHCTPLVDMNLDAVNVSRVWIRENASRKWGT